MPTTTADPQFGRGQTLGGGVAVLTDPTFGVGTAGFEKVFMDQNPATFPVGIVNIPSRYVRCIALRNNTGAVLTRGALVKFRTTDALSLAVTTDFQVAVVDEYLPALLPNGTSGSVAIGDVFWAVIQGPTSVLTAATPTVGTKMAVGTAGNAIAGLGLGETIATAANGLVRLIVGGLANSAHVPTAT